MMSPFEGFASEDPSPFAKNSQASDTPVGKRSEPVRITSTCPVRNGASGAALARGVFTKRCARDRRTQFHLLYAHQQRGALRRLSRVREPVGRAGGSILLRHAPRRRADALSGA